MFLVIVMILFFYLNKDVLFIRKLPDAQCVCVFERLFTFYNIAWDGWVDWYCVGCLLDSELSRADYAHWEMNICLTWNNVIIYCPLVGLLSVGVSAALVSSVITALITSIVVCLLLKKKLSAPGPIKTTTIHTTLPPIMILSQTTGKDNIELSGNVAYAQVNL